MVAVPVASTMDAPAPLEPHGKEMTIVCTLSATQSYWTPLTQIMFRYMCTNVTADGFPDSMFASAFSLRAASLSRIP